MPSPRGSPPQPPTSAASPSAQLQLQQQQNQHANPSSQLSSSAFAATRSFSTIPANSWIVTQLPAHSPLSHEEAGRFVYSSARQHASLDTSDGQTIDDAISAEMLIDAPTTSGAIEGNSYQSTSIEATGQRRSSNAARRAVMGIMRQAAANVISQATVPEQIPLAAVASRRRHSRNASGNSNGAGIAVASTQFPTSDELFNSFLLQYNGSGANAFEAIAANLNAVRPSGRPQQNTSGGTSNSQLRHKVVYQLCCRYCSEPVCNRAMKAILLADTKIELYSTDIPPDRLALMQEDRMTQGCHCRIRDTVCGGCGNVLGYHVSQPCDRCLDAKNNGHFWMFYSETVQAAERPDPRAEGKPLYWGSLSPMREHEEFRRQETACR